MCIRDSHQGGDPARRRARGGAAEAAGAEPGGVAQGVHGAVEEPAERARRHDHRRRLRDGRGAPRADGRRRRAQRHVSAVGVGQLVQPAHRDPARLGDEPDGSTAAAVRPHQPRARDGLG
eukprot:3301018-Prymnesium_polylepis.1